VDIERATEYSGEDSEMTLHVHQVLWPRSGRCRAAFCLRADRDAGVRGAAAHRAQRRADRRGRAGAAEPAAGRAHGGAGAGEAYDIAGQPFNLGSPKQIGEILFTKLGLPVKKKTASGAPSTDEEVLQELAADYPLPARILEHRSLAKLKGTYTDKLPLMVNPATGRVHTNYAQAVAVTGRLSSNDPNLQNIPIRTAEGRRVREAFIAPPGHVIDERRLQPDRTAHHGPHQRRPGLLRAFERGWTCTRPPPAEVLAPRWPKSAASSGATPRSSTSA
jgi:DNA polymerase-1